MQWRREISSLRCFYPSFFREWFLVSKRTRLKIRPEETKEEREGKRIYHVSGHAESELKKILRADQLRAMVTRKVTHFYAMRRIPRSCQSPIVSRSFHPFVYAYLLFGSWFSTLNVSCSPCHLHIYVTHKNTNKKYFQMHSPYLLDARWGGEANFLNFGIENHRSKISSSF